MRMRYVETSATHGSDGRKFERHMAAHPPLDRVNFGGVGTSGIRSTKWWYLVCDLSSVDTKSGTWWSVAKCGLYW